MSDFLEVKNKALSGLNLAAYFLEKMSDNLFNVGFEKLSTQIGDTALTIKNNTKSLDEAITKDLYRQFDQAQQSSINVLNAAMAGIKLAEANEKCPHFCADNTCVWRNQEKCDSVPCLPIPRSSE